MAYPVPRHSDAPFPPPVSQTKGWSLRTKMNILILVIFASMLLITITVLHLNIRRQVESFGKNQARQQADSMRNLLLANTEDIVRETQIIAQARAVEQMLRLDDDSVDDSELIDAMEMSLSAFFEDVDIYDADGNRLLDIEEEETNELVDTYEDRLMEKAMTGTMAKGLIPIYGHDSTPGSPSALTHVRLSVAVPIIPIGNSTIQGVLLTSQRIDNDALLPGMEDDQNEKDIFFIYNGYIIPLLSEHEGDEDTSYLLSNPAIEQASGGEVVVSDEIIIAHGAAHSLAYAPFQIGDDHAMIAVQFNLEPLAAFQQTLTVTLSVIFVVVSLATLGGVHLFVRSYITRPLDALQTTVEAIAEGDYNRRAEITSTDEIGQVAAACNQMADQVQERTVALQKALVAAEESHALAMQREQEHASLQQQVIDVQQTTLRALSTPIIPIANDVVTMPLIGAMDSRRAQDMLERLLDGLAQHRARIAILDITGVDAIDTHVAASLIQTSQAVKLVGAQMILTGIQPQVAQTLVELGIDLSDILTRGTLQEGITYALQQRGKQKGLRGS